MGINLASYVGATQVRRMVLVMTTGSIAGKLAEMKLWCETQ